MISFLRSRCRLAGVLVGVLVSLLFVVPVMAQGVEDDRCAGWGLPFAMEQADDHNSRLYGLEPGVDKRRHAFQSRMTQFGRLQSGREVCARMDLERDLYLLWRIAGMLAVALLGFSVAWGGLVWMLENLGVSQQGRARMLMVNCFIGVMIVGVAFFLWQSMYTGTFGFFTMEVGEFNPIGAPISYE